MMTSEFSHFFMRYLLLCPSLKYSSLISVPTSSSAICYVQISELVSIFAAIHIIKMYLQSICVCAAVVADYLMLIPLVVHTLDH